MTFCAVFALGSTAVTARAQGMMAGLPIDGIQCNATEGVVEHIHAHLQIFNHGHRYEIPAGIGITQSCLYWLHTHTPDGIIHIESPTKRPFTLGEFFDIWDANLSWTQAADVSAPRGHKLEIWVDGKRVTGRNPRSIVLHDHQEIVIQNGPPFGKPSHYDWSNL